MTYGYARTSSYIQENDDNSIEVQEYVLREAGATVICCDYFIENGNERPELKKLLYRIVPGDTLIVTKLDRIARSLIDAYKLINVLIECGVIVNILNLGIIDNSPMSKMVRNVFFAIAESEIVLIKERAQERGIIPTQHTGHRGGRQPKYTEPKIKDALELLEKHTLSQVVKATKIPKNILAHYQRKKLEIHLLEKT